MWRHLVLWVSLCPEWLPLRMPPSLALTYCSRSNMAWMWFYIAGEFIAMTHDNLFLTFNVTPVSFIVIGYVYPCAVDAYIYIYIYIYNIVLLSATAVSVALFCQTMFIIASGDINKIVYPLPY